MRQQRNFGRWAALCSAGFLALACGSQPAPQDVAPTDDRRIADTVAQDIAPFDAGDDVSPDSPTIDAPAVDTADVAMDTGGGDVRPIDVPVSDVGPTDVPAGDALDPYPAGPYGITEGATLANLQWDGYINNDGTAISTTLPFVRTSMAALRSGRRGYGLIHLSEFF